MHRPRRKAEAKRLPSVVALVALVSCSREAVGTRESDAGAPAASTAAPAAPTLLEPPVRPGSMAPYLTVAGQDVLMTWIERLDGTAAHGGSAGEAHRVRWSRLRDGAWSAAVTIAEDASIVANWADVPSVARGHDGALVAHWAEQAGDSPYAYDVVLARSTDEGASWKRLGSPHDDGTKTEHGFVSLVPDGTGVRAFWLDGRAMAEGHQERAMTLRTAMAGEDGISARELLDPRVCDCCRTAATQTATGPLVVYRDRSESEIRDLAVVTRTRTEWQAPAAVAGDGWNISGCPVNGPAVAAHGDRVAAAWYTYAKMRSRVRVALSDDGGRTFSAPILVAGPAGRHAPIGRVGVALDESEVIVSWIDSDREDAQLLVARVAPDGRVGKSTVVTKTRAGRDSGFPQLVRVANELVFAWTEPGQSARVRTRRLLTSDLAPPGERVEPSTAATGLLAVGAEAPKLSARTLDGDVVHLASLHGKPVLVNLWATWCEPCRMELSELAKLHARHVAAGLVVLAVSVDRNQTGPQLQRFVERRKLPFRVWHDPEDVASNAFSVTTLPATFLIDSNGEVRFAHMGAITANDEALARAIAAALGS